MNKKKIYIKISKPIEVGDLVRCVKYDDEFEPGDIRKVSRLGVSTDKIFYVYGSKEPCLKKYWEPVRVVEPHRAEMERAVGKMIVELMDRAEKKKLMPRIYCYKNKNTDKTTRVYFNDEGYDAKLHPDDTWDTLTGLFVALSKAAGRKLPDWIYGEATKTKTTDCHYCRGIESHDAVAIKTVLDEYSRMISAYKTPYNYCPNCGRKIKKD